MRLSSWSSTRRMVRLTRYRRVRGGAGKDGRPCSLAGRMPICYPGFDMSNAVRHAEAGTMAACAEGGLDATAKSWQRREMRFNPGTPVVGGAVLAPEQSAGPPRRNAVELSAFFERLRQVLDDRGMSQADLARELGVGVATVSEWFTR